MKTLNKHEILMIRACKICDNEKSIRRLKKIMRTHYLDDSESVMLHWLFELALMIYPNDMHWAFTLGRCESWRSGEDETFNQIATRQLISKIRLTKVVDLPKGFIPALKYRKKESDK